MSSLRTKLINPPSVLLLTARLIVWLGTSARLRGGAWVGEEFSFA